MDYSQSFSALNEKLRPRITSSEQLNSSLNRLEDRQSGSLRGRTLTYRPTVLPKEPEPKVTVATTEPEDPEEPEDDAGQEDLVSNGLLSCIINELDLKDVGEEELVEEDSRTSRSEEKDIPGELTSKGTGGPSESVAGEGGSSFQRSYLDGTLPDLIRSGRPLGRRRTLGHVSDTVGQQALCVCVLV